MYSTCIFCNSQLGRNRTLERFPVGHRLAFDAYRGRLWVVCGTCLRWNLSPLEERWEVIEDCERLYRATRVRVSTEQIGLARLPAGLELVRIGRPLRPEFAAWRYGDQFARRRKRALLGAAAGLAGVGWLFAGGVLGGSIVGMYILYRLGVRAVKGSPNKVVAHVPVPPGTLDSRGREQKKRIQLQRQALALVSLEAAGRDAWSLALPTGKDRHVRLYGEDALRGLGLVLPPANRYGGNREMVQQAVRHIERVGDPSRFVQEVANRPTIAGPITQMPGTVRLALEMSAHEEQERRALEGELALLAAAWQEAEEIAAISDSLLLPSSVLDRLRALGR